MPRSGKVKKRPIPPDPIYKSRIVTRLINKIMRDGKKTLAQKIVYNMLDSLSEDKREAVAILEQSIKNIMPKQEVRSRRVGGATYQVPIPLKHDRSEALAIRWLVEICRNKKGKPMWQKLAEEVKLAYKNEGEAIKRKIDTHKMAEANKAFAHFRW